MPVFDVLFPKPWAGVISRYNLVTIRDYPLNVCLCTHSGASWGLPCVVTLRQGLWKTANGKWHPRPAVPPLSAARPSSNDLRAMVLDRVKQILSHLSLAPTAPNSSTICPYPGLSYHIGPTNIPLKHVTLSELLREQAVLNGENEALVSAWQGIRWTYRELDERSDELARSFWALGVRTGDRMSIMAGNCGEYVLVFPARQS